MFKLRGHIAGLCFRYTVVGQEVRLKAQAGQRGRRIEPQQVFNRRRHWRGVSGEEPVVDGGPTKWLQLAFRGQEPFLGVVGCAGIDRGGDRCDSFRPSSGPGVLNFT